MPETSVPPSEIPQIWSWVTGALTFIAGAGAIVWALLRRMDERPPRYIPATWPHIGPQPLSVYSTQPVNEAQIFQMLLSGQSLMLVELQKIAANQERLYQTNSNISDQLNELIQTGKETNRLLEDLVEKRRGRP